MTDLDAAGIGRAVSDLVAGTAAIAEMLEDYLLFVEFLVRVGAFHFGPAAFLAERPGRNIFTYNYWFRVNRNVLKCTC